MAHHLCPDCGSPLKQIHRRSFDRLITQFYPIHRYRCSNANCRWEGLLHSGSHKGPKRKPQWLTWVLIALLGVAVGVALFEHLSTPPEIKTDISTSP
jgi:hypothetical protein